MTIVDLRGREAGHDVVALLADAQIHRERADARQRAPAIAGEYATNSNLRLWGFETHDGIVAVLGLEQAAAQRAIIRDLAVRETHRGQGIGRSLLGFARDTLGIPTLEGDTLLPSVAFYEHCGFTVRPDGTMPNGDVRYRFSWPG